MRLFQPWVKPRDSWVWGRLQPRASCRRNGGGPSVWQCADCQAVATPRRVGGAWRRGKLAAEAAPTREESSRASRSEEHTSELQSLMRSAYAVICLIKKK